MAGTPFDALAAEYDQRWAMTTAGCHQRQQVHARITNLWPAGASILELGAGTGIDAVFLAHRGLRVLATDPAAAMLAVARQRCQALEQIRFQVLAAEQVGSLDECFDGAFSNFAALNCVCDLDAFAATLAGRLRPGAPVALCLFSCTCLWEIVASLGRGQWSRAWRRRRRGTVEAAIGDGQSVRMRYHSPAEVARAFAPYFTPLTTIAIGLSVPPPAWRLPGILQPALALADQFDRACGHLPLLRHLGDHALYLCRRLS